MADETLDFDKFVNAVQKYDLGKEAAQATSHTSAVTVKEWDQVQEALKDDETEEKAEQ